MPDPGPDGAAEVRTRTPIGYAVFFKPFHVKGARWKRVAVAATHAEAVALVAAKGNWWIATRTVEAVEADE